MHSWSSNVIHLCAEPFGRTNDIIFLVTAFVTLKKLLGLGRVEEWEAPAGIYASKNQMVPDMDGLRCDFGV